MKGGYEFSFPSFLDFLGDWFLIFFHLPFFVIFIKMMFDLKSLIVMIKIKLHKLIENVQKILNIIFENISAKCVLGEIKSDSPKCSLKDCF